MIGSAVILKLKIRNIIPTRIAFDENHPQPPKPGLSALHVTALKVDISTGTPFGSSYLRMFYRCYYAIGSSYAFFSANMCLLCVPVQQLL
jgi:hypothetical protein